MNMILSGMSSLVSSRCVMKILFLSEILFNPNFGGVQRVTDSLARALVKKGFNVEYLCASVPTPEMLEFDFPAKFSSLPAEGFFYSIENSNYLASYIVKNKIDVVVNQCGLESYFNPLLNICKNRCKVISVVHSTPMAYMYAAMYSHLLPSNSVKDRIKNFIKFALQPIYRQQKIRVHKRWQKRHYEELVCKSDAVVLLSEQYKRDFVFCKANVDFEKIVAIPNPNSFPKQKVDFNIKKNVILFSGRLSPEKNPMALLKAWKRIYNQLPAWELWFVGDGDQYNSMSEYITKNNLERVTLCGRRSNMIDYYHQAKIVCLTSYYEGWGMALTEGMQCGCVPVAFDSYAAASDIIDDGVNGILVTPFKIKELSGALYKLANDDVLLKQYAKAAYEKTSQFDITVVADKWEQALQSI